MVFSLYQLPIWKSVSTDTKTNTNKTFHLSAKPIYLPIYRPIPIPKLYRSYPALSIYPFISLIDLSISNNRIYLVKSNLKALRVIESRRRRGESICPLAKIYFVADFSNNYQFLSNLVLLTFSFQKERSSKYPSPHQAVETHLVDC